MVRKFRDHDLILMRDYFLRLTKVRKDEVLVNAICFASGRSKRQVPILEASLMLILSTGTNNSTRWPSLGVYAFIRVEKLERKLKNPLLEYSRS
jgi:hypothetical protein